MTYENAKNHTKYRIGLVALISILMGAILISVSLSLQQKLTQQRIAEIGDTLRIFLGVTKHELYQWHQHNEANVLAWAEDPRIRVLVEKLLKTERDANSLRNSDALMQIRGILAGTIQRLEYTGFFIISPDGFNIGSMRDANLAHKNLLPDGFRDTVLMGNAETSVPQKSDVPLLDENGKLVPELATVFAAAPVKDSKGQVVAILAFRLSPQKDLNRLLESLRLGNTGETYAVSEEGLLLSNSRFENDLRRKRLLATDKQSALNIRLATPQSGSNQPTQLFSLIRKKERAVVLDPYEDYRGQFVIGAGYWDRHLDLGIVSEMDYDEAFNDLETMITIVQTGTGLLCVVIVLLAGLMIHNIRRAQEEGVRMQLKVAERTRQLEKANQAKDDFLSSMSHELRTPLNAILGFSQVIEIDSKDSDTRHHAGEIVKAGRHLLALIDDILDLAKIESGKLSVSVESVEVVALVSECIALMEPVAVSKGIVLVDNTISRRQCHIEADYFRTKQVLLNLMSNAIKYNRDDGSVTIECQSMPSRYTRIIVKDTGFGISQRNQERLFRPFERVGEHRDRIEGTGIGLVITERLIKLMGGNIGFDSEEGKGSTFWIELPAASEIDKPYMPEKTRKLRHNTQLKDKRNVVYIEDNPSNLRLVKKIFNDYTNHTLRTAPDAGIGLDLIRSTQPDLILLDINLPEMDGYSILDNLRQDPKTRDIPVIAVSANAMGKDIEMGLSLGFSAYLTKPLDLDKFLETVEEFV